MTEYIAEVIAVFGKQIISVFRPFRGEVTQYLINREDGAISLPENNLLTISVHRVLGTRTAEHTTCLFTIIPIRPFIIPIHLHKQKNMNKPGTPKSQKRLESLSSIDHTAYL